MNNCNGECASCSATCHENCPTCKAPGKLVPAITVASLSTQSVDLDEEYYLCLRPNCDTIYFTKNGQYITKEEVKVPVWFKSKYDEYIVCYCRNIYLKDIVNAVIALKGINDKRQVLEFLEKKETPGMCIIKNPTGVPCDELFDNALTYALNIYNKIKEQS